MIINTDRPPTEPVILSRWHTIFAILPRRVSGNEIAWLQKVERRYVEDDKGCWAGGAQWHWDYRLPGSDIYVSQRFYADGGRGDHDEKRNFIINEEPYHA